MHLFLFLVHEKQVSLEYNIDEMCKSLCSAYVSMVILSYMYNVFIKISGWTKY